MLLKVRITDLACTNGDILVTTSGILQEQKFSKPRSIGYTVLEASDCPVVITGLDKLQEVLVELLGELAVVEGEGSASSS